jgi:hypothetical protein
MLWTDEDNTDLIGTVGGVLMQAGQDIDGSVVGPGVYWSIPTPIPPWNDSPPPVSRA